MSCDSPVVRRALLSVSDKAGVVDFARALVALGIEILSTGGTFKQLAAAGVAAKEVSAVTGFPELMGGRLKTLHPLIHGGILARRDADRADIEGHGLPLIDLVAVNLYPFAATVAAPGHSLGEALEQIDIGGPTMIRAAAKNHRFVTVITNPGDYEPLITQLRNRNGSVPADVRFRLACQAFEHTAAYDDAIANYLGGPAAAPPAAPALPEAPADDQAGGQGDTPPSSPAQPEAPTSDQASGRGDTPPSSPPSSPHFPRTLNLQFHKRQDLRYGENPHQAAAFYSDRDSPAGGLAAARQHQGRALSYNNIADADAALDCVTAIAEPACVIVKHANPCGAACGETPLRAYQRAFECDPTSAFGGIIAFNRPLDADTAGAIVAGQFAEVIIAPAITAEALAVTSAKENLRVLSYGERPAVPLEDWHYQRVHGGLLVQERDRQAAGSAEWSIVTARQPSAAETADLQFAWTMVRFVKSNAIVYCRDRRTIGIGGGQTSRVYSATLAGLKAQDAKLDTQGAVMASDAFFPFRDGVDAARDAGIAAVIQPGGSIRDPEVIAAADEAGMAMAFTGSRHFRH